MSLAPMFNLKHLILQLIINELISSKKGNLFHREMKKISIINLVNQEN